jgi:hypothetical protein
VKRFGLAAAGTCAAAIAFGGPAYAFPTTAYTSDPAPYGRAECLSRATGALTAEGWGDARPSGSIGVLAHKEPNSAYILCLEAAAPTAAGRPAGGTTVIVFVASADPNLAVPADEAARLRQRMLQR